MSQIPKHQESQTKGKANIIKKGRHSLGIPSRSRRKTGFHLLNFNSLQLSVVISIGWTSFDTWFLFRRMLLLQFWPQRIISSLLRFDDGVISSPGLSRISNGISYAKENTVKIIYICYPIQYAQENIITLTSLPASPMFLAVSGVYSKSIKIILQSHCYVISTFAHWKPERRKSLKTPSLCLTEWQSLSLWMYHYCRWCCSSRFALWTEGSCHICYLMPKARYQDLVSTYTEKLNINFRVSANPQSNGWFVKLPRQNYPLIQQL